MKTDEKADLVEHLEELRFRIIRSLGYVGAGIAAGWFLYPYLYLILLAPIRKALQSASGKMFVSGPLEGFMTQFNVSVIAGVALAGPLVLWELWRFVGPGLTDTERRAARPLLPLAGVLFALGVALCYWMAPRMFIWLMGFTPPDAVAMFKLQEQVSLVAKMYLAFGLCFELPLLLAFLLKVGIITPEFLRRRRKEAIACIFLLAAVVTPTPDAFNMSMLAVPLVVLYELTVWWARATARKTKHEEPV